VRACGSAPLRRAWAAVASSRRDGRRACLTAPAKHLSWRVTAMAARAPRKRARRRCRSATSRSARATACLPAAFHLHLSHALLRGMLACYLVLRLCSLLDGCYAALYDSSPVSIFMNFFICLISHCCASSLTAYLAGSAAISSAACLLWSCSHRLLPACLELVVVQRICHRSACRHS